MRTERASVLLSAPSSSPRVRNTVPCLREQGQEGVQRNMHRECKKQYRKPPKRGIPPSMFQQTEPLEVDVGEKQATCQFCGETKFWIKKAQLNTAVTSFFDIDWLDPEGLRQLRLRALVSRASARWAVVSLKSRNLGGEVGVLDPLGLGAHRITTDRQAKCRDFICACIRHCIGARKLECGTLLQPEAPPRGRECARIPFPRYTLG
jgi:hypothetical protein